MTMGSLAAWPAQDQFLVARADEFALVDADSGACITTIPNGTDDFRVGFAVSRDGRRLAIRSLSGLEVVQVDTGDRSWLLREPHYFVIAFSGSDRLVTSTRSELVLWDLLTSSVIARQAAHHVVGLAATEQYVAAASGQQVRLLDATSLEELACVQLGREVSHCDFDDTGERLVVTGTAGLYVFAIR